MYIDKFKILKANRKTSFFDKNVVCIATKNQHFQILVKIQVFLALVFHGAIPSILYIFDVPSL